jgi:phage portal protein
MDFNLASRLKNAWNAFQNKSPNYVSNYGGTYYKPDRIRLTRGNERSIVTSIYNRISLDVASISIRHCILDDEDRFMEYKNSSLDSCLNLEANLDQTSRSFIQDVVMSLFDEGCIAIVPVDTVRDPMKTDSYDITSMRVGHIITWYPDSVKLEVYNEQKGIKEEIVLPKRIVSIIENPLYSIMNEPNSTLQRLIRKLNLLDAIDEQSGSGKLDLIIQLPYTVKTEIRREQAERRRKDIEEQLQSSKYGVAYTDGTEKITQLNRSVENNLLKQIEYLTSMLYSQLGITQTVLDGTADEQTMLNYYSRTIEPIISAITDEMKRKFLTKTARTQKQTILFFRDPFKLIPSEKLAELADKFTRNEIMTSNEFRQIVGRKPSSDPKADQLINSNLNHSPDEQYTEYPEEYEENSQYREGEPEYYEE